MTSEKAMLILAVCLFSAGCGLVEPTKPELVGPYDAVRVWAVAPLRNESGSAHADGLRTADHLANQLESASPVDTLAVNRTLAAMEALDVSEIRTETDAQQVMAALQADGLVVGTLTAWDPYDPPKIGIALELYVRPELAAGEGPDLDALVRAATADEAGIRRRRDGPPSQPVSAVSAYLDAASPETRELLHRYAQLHGERRKLERAPRRYWISMDLYSEFTAFEMSRRLLEAENRRLRPPEDSAS